MKKVQIFMLGSFDVVWDNQPLPSSIWARDKSVQLFQYLCCNRHLKTIHKEQIIDGLWYALDLSNPDQTFKTAVHGLNKALESVTKEIGPILQRQQTAYQLDFSKIWLDTEAFESLIKRAQDIEKNNATLAVKQYIEAFELYQGIFIPNRIYEDWSSLERERLQLLYLNGLTKAAELSIAFQPEQSVRLSQLALLVDETWESAYRIQMLAFLAMGNRPMALKSYEQCTKVLLDNFGIEPLMLTKKVLQQVRSGN